MHEQRLGDPARGYAEAMVHLRIVVPADRCGKVLDLLEAAPSTSNLVFLAGAARQPRGDVVLCDIAREDASVLIDDLKELGVARDGSISLEQIDSQISDAADAGRARRPRHALQRGRLGGGRGAHLARASSWAATSSSSWCSPA